MSPTPPPANPSSPLPLLLATANPHKVDELRQIFAAAGISVHSLADIPGGRGLPEPDEHASTFLENATIKARAYARATGRVCLSDDSGLAVDALDGAPGANSSHFASPSPSLDPAGAAVFSALSRDRRDSLNNARLLALMESAPEHTRSARFVCVMVLAAPDGAVLHHTRGEFHGRIGTPPRIPAGANGFGYDPLFLVAPDFTRTGAELDPAEKNRLSHRALAAHAMALWLADHPQALVATDLR